MIEYLASERERATRGRTELHQGSVVPTGTVSGHHRKGRDQPDEFEDKMRRMLRYLVAWS